MTSGIEISLQLLTSTRNEAAAGVLVHALDSPHKSVREGALQALLTRRSPVGQRELIARWHDLDAKFKEIIVEHRGSLSSAIRDAVLSPDAQLCANGCAAAQCTGEYEIAPALLNVVESQESEHVDLAAQTLLRLAQSLHDELARPLDWRERRDPQIVRSHVVSALELAARRYPQHGRKEILNSFLTLTGRENATLKNILREPLDNMHATIVDLLTGTRRPAILRLLLSFLDDSRAPQSALLVLARRTDDDFLKLLMEKVGAEPGSAARVNLKRLTKIHWLQPGGTQWIVNLDDSAQVALIQVVIYSGIPQPDKINVLKEILNCGHAAARLAATEALAEFKGVEANRLVMQALRDTDLDVQAAAMSQLRQRGLPGAMATLIEALDSSHLQLQKAARDSLREFTFERFLSAYEGMEEEVRRSTGQLVRKVDLNTERQLAAEMKSASRSRRLRAIEVALSLDAVVEMELEFHQLLADSDYLVRLEAADALVRCPTERTRMALREATLDDSAAVSNAAQRALDEMVTAGPRRSVPIDFNAIGLPEHITGSSVGGGTW